MWPKRPGDSGVFYGVDVHGGRLREFSERCRRESLGNVVTILGGEVDPRLPERELDLVFFISTYHHLGDPVGLLRNVGSSLRHGARLHIRDADNPGGSGDKKHFVIPLRIVTPTRPAKDPASRSRTPRP